MPVDLYILRGICSEIVAWNLYAWVTVILLLFLSLTMAFIVDIDLGELQYWRSEESTQCFSMVLLVKCMYKEI